MPGIDLVGESLACPTDRQPGLPKPQGLPQERIRWRPRRQLHCSTGVDQEGREGVNAKNFVEDEGTEGFVSPHKNNLMSLNPLLRLQIKNFFWSRFPPEEKGLRDWKLSNDRFF